ncbi:hypothetical protein Vretimale_11176, partial [Volvox reticuliferus]
LGTAPGCRGVVDGCSTVRATSASGQDILCPTNGCSAASTPPEPPAVSAATSGASSSSSGPPCRNGAAAAVASMDSADPALLARLGGAARNLYRAASYPSANMTHGSISPQLDLSQLAAMDLVVQVVIPSSLHDITGASVRATACAAYSKLCRRRAWYGAAAAVAATDAQAPSFQHAAIAATNSATTVAQMPGGRGDGSGGDCGGGCGCLGEGHQCVASSCSGRTTLYEPLVAVAPLALPAVAAADDEPVVLPLPLPPPPVHQWARSPTVATQEAAAAGSPLRNVDPATVPQHAGGSCPAGPPPTLHGCYAWWKCPEASGRGAAAVAAGSQSCGALCHPTQRQRCWLAMAFCDSRGKLLDARALALCVDAHDGAAVDLVAAGAGSGSGSGALAPDGASIQAARSSSQSQFCNCKADSGGGGGGGGGGRHDRNALLAPRCWKGGGGGRSEALADLGNAGGSSLLPTDWGQPEPQPQAKRVEMAQPTLGTTGGTTTTPAAAHTALDALVCRTVLGHARLLSRQLAEAYSGTAVAGGTSGAASTEGGVTPSGAVGASVTRRRVIRGSLAVPLTLAKLGAPTPTEASEWRALLQPLGCGGGGGSGGERPRASSGALLRRRWDQAAPPPQSTTSAVSSPATTLSSGPAAAAAATFDTTVTLAWLDPHPSVVVQPGCRLPLGGFAISPPSSEPQPYSVPLPPMPPNPTHAHLHSQQQQQAGGPRAPLSLVAFPAQRPPSASCAAAEALNRHLRLLSVHPWPRQIPPSGTGAVAVSTPASAAFGRAGGAGGGRGGGEEGQLPAVSASLAQADGLAVGPPASPANPKRPVGCSTTARSPSGTDTSDAWPLGPDHQHYASGHAHQQKRQRWSERVDGAADDGAGRGGVFDSGSSIAAGLGGSGTMHVHGWSDPSWSTLRDLYGLCLLRDWLLAAQSGARGGPLPGRCPGAVNGVGNVAGGSGDWDMGMEDADGDGDNAGSDAPLLLPLHAAVCRQLLRMLVACERLAANL